MLEIILQFILLCNNDGGGNPSKKRGTFQSLTAAVNILPEMCQKNPNFRSSILKQKKKSGNNNYDITENPSGI